MAATPATVVEPRSRDADRSQLAILRRGDGRVRASTASAARAWTRIAERAGVNKRLIYYYFGGKDELFLAVLEQTYADIRDAEQRAAPRAIEPARGDPPAGRVHLALLPRAPRVPDPAQQREPAPRRPPEALARGSAQMNSPLIEMLADVLERGERERRVPRRHRPDAALHLDRRRWPTSTCRTTTRCRRSSAAT